MGDPLLAACAGVLGAAVGSFLNVCIVRLPEGLSVIRPRSRCPSCGSAVQGRDNVPLLSWIILRGRCRDCGERIAWLYPVVEVATVAIWAGMAWLRGPTPAALSGAVLLTLLLGIAITDWRRYVIPDAMSLGGLAAGLAASLAAGPPSPPDSVAGAATGFGVLYAVGWLGERALRKPALGGGDVKLLAMVGAFLGPLGALLTLFLGALAGTLVFGPRSLRTGEPVPFGTFLAVGAALAHLFGARLAAAYLDWLAV